MKNIWVILLLLVLPTMSNAATGGGGSGWEENGTAKKARVEEYHTRGIAAPAGNTSPLAVPPSASTGTSSAAPAAQADKDFWAIFAPQENTARTFDLTCWCCKKDLGQEEMGAFGLCDNCLLPAESLPTHPGALPSMASAQSLPVNCDGGTGEKSGASTASDDTWPAPVPGISFICYACSDDYQYPTQEALEMHWRIASIADPLHRENAEKYTHPGLLQSIPSALLHPVTGSDGYGNRGGRRKKHPRTPGKTADSLSAATTDPIPTKNSLKYKCPKTECRYVANSNATLTKHIDLHANKKCLVCEICDYRVPPGRNHAQDLARHSRIHSGDKQFECQFCGHRASDPSAIKRHKESCSPKPKTYAKKHHHPGLLPALFDPATGGGGSGYHGAGAQATLTDEDDTSQERYDTDVDASGSSEEEDGFEEITKCPHCPYLAKSNKLSKHIFKHVQKHIICKFCHYLALSMDGFEKHVTNKHHEYSCEEAKGDSSDFEEEDAIDNTFSSGRRRRRRRKHSRTPGKTAASLSAATTDHLPTKSSRRYKCQEPACRYVANSGATLIKHIGLHANLACLVCEFCDYRIIKVGNNAQDFERHRRIHFGDKPFECYFCSYCASDRSAIRKHEIKCSEKPQTAVI